MCVLFAPAILLSVLCDGCAGTASVLYLLFVIYYILIVTINCYYLLLTILLLLILKRAFKWASRRVNLTKQPPLSPGRLKEGRYLTLIVGAIDRGE